MATIPEDLDGDAAQRLVQVLANIFYDADQARLLTSRAGFPTSRIPAFSTPLVFWSRVVEEARNGTLVGGVRPLLEVAAQMYPHNRQLAQLRDASNRSSARPHESPRSLTRSGSPSQGLEAIAQRFFDRAGRTMRRDRDDLLVPERVRIHESLPGRLEVRALGLALSPGESGYLVHRGTLSEDTETALNTLRLQGMSIVPLSEPQIRAALQDDNSRTVLHALTQRARGGDNPFLTRNALIDRRFVFGRSELLARMGSALGRGEQILITGSRKLGKTSFLNILRQDLSDWPVAFFDLQRYQRDDDRWVEHLFEELVATYDRWGSSRFGDWPGQRESITSGIELETALLRRRQWHAEREQPLPQFVIILDELERLLPRPGEREVANTFIRATGPLRALAQGHERFISLIAADLRPHANRLNDLEGAGTNPLFRFFQEVPLPPLAPAAIREMLRTLGRMMGIERIDDELCDEISALSGGHPYVARTIAGAAVNDRKDPYAVGLEDLEVGLEVLEEDDELGDFFRANFWRPLTTDEQGYLLDLALERKPAKNKRVRASLKYQGLIDREGIRIRAFRDWIRELDEELTPKATG